MQALFEAVREACSRPVWSRGVELVRSGGISTEREGRDEIVLRVAGDRGLLSPTVVLYPSDEEWECDCGSADDPCAHVAAAAIACQRAEREGDALPSSEKAGGKLEYEFRRLEGGLGFRRFVVTDAGEEPLETTLAALAAGRVEGPACVAGERDLAVERTLGSLFATAATRPVPRGVLRQLVRALDGVRVRLDGEAVTVCAEPAEMVARLTDAEGGFRLVLAREPAVERELGDGLVRCGDEIRPLGRARLTGRELDAYGRGLFFAPDRVAELVAEVLPDLAARIPVRVETRRLPKSQREAPRIELEVERRGDRLSLLPLLVYGDPACARVDAGRLVPLRGAVPIRDEAAERRVVQDLRTRLGLAPGHRIELEDEEAVGLAERLREWGGAVRGDAHREFYEAGALEAAFTLVDDDFSLRFEAEGREADSADTLRAWREGRSLVPLQGGGFAPLPVAWLERHGERLADLLAAREAAGRLPASALPDLARLCESLETPPPPGFGRLRKLVDGFEGITPGEPPADLTATLRDYQRHGVGWLQFLREAGLGGLLADDMGLGKTLQALCALRGRTLVVSPTSVLHNWEAEACRFRPSLRLCVYHGPARSLDPEADVVLTTYALLRLDAERLAREDWGTVVLDEAQAIKNPASQVARAAFGLRADFRVALTGTPVENRLDELWSQLHFANPGLLGPRSDFDARYARPVAAGDVDAVARLRERIRPFVLRRRKAEVAPELPPRQEDVLYCTLDESERAVYDAVRAATRADLVERLRSGGSVIQALEALLRLRQACCHPGLVPRRGGDGTEPEDSSKLRLLRETLETVVSEGHKALVFSQWTSLLDRVEPGLGKSGIAWNRLDGSTRDRRGVVTGFSREDGPPVLLLSLKAGGTGLNLTAADHVFLLDPWWNPAAEDQAADRAHRIGQTRPVMVHRLVAEDTVEERILELQARKRALAEAALGEAEAAGSISRDDLLALLE